VNWTKSLPLPSVLLGLAAMLPILASGCGGDSGPQRYDLSGAVSFDGKPVPVGEISLAPDASQGNSGPGCIALIKDGQYKTEPGMGILGGPYTVQILGFDGIPVGEATDGTALFPPYETKVDFPKEATTHDFAVPAASTPGG
jgi:hypothetical protein